MGNWLSAVHLLFTVEPRNESSEDEARGCRGSPKRSGDNLYRLQLDAGRHVLREHPETATSWADDAMRRLLLEPKVSTTVSDQCEYG